MNNLLLLDLYDLAYNANRNTSFSPEKRAEQTLKEYSEELESDQTGMNSETKSIYIDKYRSYLRKYLASRAGCASTMITGPANFNVARNEKRQRWAEGNYNKFREFRERFLNAIRKQAIKNRTPNEAHNLKWESVSKRIIESANVVMNIDNGVNTTYSRTLFVNSISNRIKELAKCGDVETLNKAIELLKNLNEKGLKPIISSKSEIWKLETVAEAIREQKVDSLEKPNETFNFEGGVIIINHSMDRIQVKHGSKPAYEVIAVLKMNAFKWSPKNQVWQRQLTRNAIYSTERIFNIDLS